MWRGVRLRDGGGGVRMSIPSHAVACGRCFAFKERRLVFPDCNYSQDCSTGPDCNYSQDCSTGPDCNYSQDCSTCPDCNYSQDCSTCPDCNYSQDCSTGPDCNYSQDCSTCPDCNYSQDYSTCPALVWLLPIISERPSCVTSFSTKTIVLNGHFPHRQGALTTQL